MLSLSLLFFALTKRAFKARLKPTPKLKATKSAQKFYELEASASAR
jgi:hypothetical protein